MADNNNPGIKSEKRIAKILGGEGRIGSGSLDSCKGDFTTKMGHIEFLGECKATQAGSISIKYEWLLKIASEARELVRHPLFTLSFIRGDGAAKKRGDWIAMPLGDYKQFVLEFEDMAAELETLKDVKDTW